MPGATLAGRSPSQILSERMQFIAAAMLSVFLFGWLLWFYPYRDLLDRSGTPLGADYSMFYIAGTVAADGAWDQLYDQAVHQRRLHALLSGIDPDFALPFRYPPFVAAVMAPLSRLPYALSYAVFTAFSLSACGWTWRLLAADLTILRGQWRRPILITAMGWPVVLETLIGGQASLFALWIASAVLVCLRRKQLLLAGAALGLAVYKPNVLAIFAFGCILYQPKLLRGAVPMAAALTILSWATAGAGSLWEYASLSSRLAADTWSLETPLWKVHGLSIWIDYLAPGRGKAAAGLIGLTAAALIALRWRKCNSQNTAAANLALALLLAVNALCNPYTPLYDLSLLMIAALLTAESLTLMGGDLPAVRLARRLSTAQLILATLFFGPHLSQALAKLIGWQAFPLALLALALWQARLFWQASRTVVPAQRVQPAGR